MGIFDMTVAVFLGSTLSLLVVSLGATLYAKLATRRAARAKVEKFEELIAELRGRVGEGVTD